MAIYWFMFILPSMLAIMPIRAEPNLSRLAWSFVGAAMVLIVGLRYEVGGDWWSYLYKFQEAFHQSVADSGALYTDPAYWFFNWLFSNLGLGIWSLNLFCALFSVSGVMAVARRQPRPWIALAVAVPYILIVVSMGYARQAAALGLVCWAFLAVEDRRTWRFVLLVTAATAFHKSAAVVMPLFLLTLPRIKFKHWILLGGVLFFVIAAFIADTLETQWQNYVVQEKESDGALIRVAMNLPAALLLLLLKRRLRMGDSRFRHYYWLALASVSAVFLVSYASTAVDRLALYLLPLQMVVYGRVHQIFEKRLYRTVVSVSVLLVYAAVLYVWCTFATHASSWVPYQFYPLVG